MFMLAFISRTIFISREIRSDLKSRNRCLALITRPLLFGKLKFPTCLRRPLLHQDAKK